MRKILAVIDMQNDFISGSLGTDEARRIVPKVVERIREYQSNNDMVLFTQDTHYDNYLETQEGKHLPVTHCIEDTDGWNICSDIVDVIDSFQFYCYKKSTFGSLDLADDISAMGDVTELELCGICTDVCVVSNALILKTKLPELKITVNAEYCAGVTNKSHEAALLVMKMCHINVIE